MSAGLAIAILAEHVTTGDPLPALLARLGGADRADLPGMVIEVECAAIALRDLVAPRNESRPGPVGKQSAPDGTVLQRNRYKGTCACGRHVPEGRGRAVKQGGKWAVVCYPCTRKVVSHDRQVPGQDPVHRWAEPLLRLEAPG